MVKLAGNAVNFKEAGHVTGASGKPVAGTDVIVRIAVRTSAPALRRLWY